MRMKEAKKIISNWRECKGFMVHFEWRKPPFLESDWFPDKDAGEPLIKTEEEAWQLATVFAAALSGSKRGSVVNVYVVKSDFAPVDGYHERKMNRYPPV